MKTKDQRSFLDVVEAIARSEQDVDKVLEAARLQRVEDAKRRMTGEQKFDLILVSIIAPLVFAFFALIFLAT